MNFTKKSLRLYAVTDRSWLHGETLYEQVEKALKGGVTLVQLREKELSEADFEQEAKELLAEMTLSEVGDLCIWDSISSIPVNKKALDNERMQVPNKFFGTSVVEAGKTAVSKMSVFNYSPKALAETDIVMPYFVKAVNGELSIDEALTAAEKDLKSQLGNAFE